MEVAFTTSTGIYVDLPFNKATNFSIWHVTADESCYAYSITMNDPARSTDDAIRARAEALRSCAIVCSQAIGAPAAAKLAARHIHQIKTGAPVPVEELIAKLQQSLRSAPPPWLRKIESRV